MAERPRFAPPQAPPGWDTLRHAPPTTLWAAVAPVDPGTPDRFRANLLLTCDLTSGSFRDWQRASDELLARTLEDYLLVDLERIEIDARPAGRRLAHHLDRAGRALTMEQWFTLDGERGWTLTATCETWHYDALADSWAVTAQAWRPVSGVAPTLGNGGEAPR